MSSDDDDEILTSVESEDVNSGINAIRKGLEGAAHTGKHIGKSLASANSKVKDASSEINPVRNGGLGDYDIEADDDEILTSGESEDLNSEIKVMRKGVEGDVHIGADDDENLTSVKSEDVNSSEIENTESVKEGGKFMFK